MYSAPELRAITHEMASGLMNLASTLMSLQSQAFENPAVVNKAQAAIEELNRLVSLHDRQRQILQEQAGHDNQVSRQLHFGFTSEL